MDLAIKNKRLRSLLWQYHRDDRSFQRFPDDNYLSLLRKYLGDLPEREISFFVNRKRFCLLRSLIGDYLRNDVRSILDVACGPFAFENYVDCHPEVRIDSFDLNPRLTGLFQALRKSGKFDNLSFRCSSVEEYSTSKTYDLVLVNDLFYHKAVDFFGVIGALSERVKPGGLLYFDILDERSKRLWSSFGKDKQFVRYNLPKIALELAKHDLELMSITPSLGIGGMPDFTMRAALYRTLRLANNYVFVARKN